MSGVWGVCVFGCMVCEVCVYEWGVWAGGSGLSCL